MSPAEISRIKIRDANGAMRVGIKPKTRGMRVRPKTGGFDIETCDGMPYILGYHGGDADHGVSQDVIEIEPGQGLLHLLRWAKQICTREKSLILGAHNIRFDLGALFFDWCRANQVEFPSESDDLKANLEGGDLHVWIGPVTFATFKFGHRTISFIDTFSYFKTSLVKSVQQLGLGETKADFAGRGDPEWYMKKFPLAEIGPYCQQDAYLAHLLVDQIVTWWMEFGILPCVSGPQMAGRVFCKEFVKVPWVSVPESALVFSMLSYHGGRNIFTGRAGWYKHLNAYDLNSAYTWAMTQMPDMTEGQWEAGMEAPAPASWGFCVVSGELPRLKYPVIYSADFKALNGGVLDHVVITTMEYDLLCQLAPDWIPTEIGWIRWVPDHTGPSDIAMYAETMWTRRTKVTTPVEKTLYKFLSNSLYGKLIARSPSPEPEEKNKMRAGELFYPPVASWITALVRCLVIKSEFDHDVIHTATDGVMTEQTMPSSGALGAFKLENQGPALIFRNKLYLHWDMSGQLKKAATHGFQGDKSDGMGGIKTLLTMIRQGNRRYGRKRLRGWKEAKRDGARPFQPISVDMQLHLDQAVWDDIVEQAQQSPFRELLEAL